jgi:ABC-type lipoprotein release transport system permease subunit
MRLFRFYWLHWVAAHPGRATGLFVLALALLLALLPLLITLLPVRKVPLLYNLRNLQLRWKTTLVTGVAFTLVTALLTVMLAFVNGMNRLTESTGHPGNVLVLSDGATDEAFSNLPPSSVALLPQDIQAMIPRSADGKTPLATQEVYVIVMYTIPHQLPGLQKRRYIQMRGFDNLRTGKQVHDIELSHGSWPSASGAREVPVTSADGRTYLDSAREAVFGEGIARILGGDIGKATLLPGDVIEIGRRRWYVSGIMKGSGSTFASEVWTLDSHLQKDFGRDNSYTAYVVRTPSAALAQRAAEAIKNFRSERNLQAMPERVYYGKLSQTNQQFGIATYFIAVVIAIGGVLGIMNTMFAAISQRTQDIGVLRLMGYRRWQILVSFQAESLLIALLGGVIGCALGLLADGAGTTSTLSSGAGGKSVMFKLIVDAGVVRMGLLFAVLMGAVGGILPSIHGMRLRPLESLK